jgi:hypothetical protein
MSRALRLLSALEREDRRRATSRRRHMGLLYAMSLAALGVLAAAPGVLAGAPKGLARSLLAGVGAVATNLRDSIGLAGSEDEADLKPSIAADASPARSNSRGLKIIVGGPPPPLSPVPARPAPQGDDNSTHNVKANPLAF